MSYMNTGKDFFHVVVREHGIFRVGSPKYIQGSPKFREPEKCLVSDIPPSSLQTLYSHLDPPPSSAQPASQLPFSPSTDDISLQVLIFNAVDWQIDVGVCGCVRVQVACRAQLTVCICDKTEDKMTMPLTSHLIGEVSAMTNKGR